MRVAVVTVGDELLAGDVTNTNAAWLGRELSERGATLERVVTIPDDEAEIASTVADLAARFDAVLVTGGLGPTHDDVTIDGVARAFDREVATHPDAAAWLDERGDYERADLVEGTAALPIGARHLRNEVGVAPGCVVENVYVLPGVPAEMKAMFATVGEEFGGQRRHVEVVAVDEPESALIDRLADLRERFDVAVGSYPGETVRVKLQATDAEAVAAAADWLRERVAVAEDGAAQR